MRILAAPPYKAKSDGAWYANCIYCIKPPLFWQYFAEKMQELHRPFHMQEIM